MEVGGGGVWVGEEVEGWVCVRERVVRREEGGEGRGELREVMGTINGRDVEGSVGESASSLGGWVRRNSAEEERVWVRGLKEGRSAFRGSKRFGAGDAGEDKGRSVN